MNITELYDEYSDKVYTFFYIKNFDKAIAEDLTSQTFMIVVEKLADHDYIIRKDSKFVYGVMRNVWLQHLQRKYRHQEQAVAEMDDFESYVTESVTEYEEKTVKQRAEVFINLLPEKQREIVTLRLLNELSVNDICRHTGKDSNYVKTTYKRGLKRLKQLVTENVTSTIYQQVTYKEQL